MTELDMEIAALLYPVLVDVARSGEPISFGDLIHRTQERHPDNIAIQHQVPVGLGRRCVYGRQGLSRPDMPRRESRPECTARKLSH